MFSGMMHVGEEVGASDGCVERGDVVGDVVGDKLGTLVSGICTGDCVGEIEGVDVAITGDAVGTSVNEQRNPLNNGFSESIESNSNTWSATPVMYPGGKFADGPSCIKTSVEPVASLNACAAPSEIAGS